VRSSMKFLIGTVAASLLVAACGSSSNSSSSSASSAAASGNHSVTIKTASVGSLGTVLVDSKGMTLYRLSGAHAGKLICTTSACVHIWSPLTVPAGAKPTGVTGLGMVKRPNGVEQVSYKGAPLYTFAQDTAPGQAKGQGIKDVGTWAAVMAGAGSSTAPASSSSSSSSGGGGYGY
jgi:predicted lipoprotein with Yx(FWY)xxD motif